MTKLKFSEKKLKIKIRVVQKISYMHVKHAHFKIFKHWIGHGS